MDIYAPCTCGSGKKFKFCCQKKMKETGMLADTQYASLPVYQCQVLKNWHEVGISFVNVTREVGDSLILVSYVVDFWCLGVKDVMVKFNISKESFKRMFAGAGEIESISYEDARSLVLRAHDFAKGIEIAPHELWNGMAASFVEVERDYVKKFEMGRDGKPFYVAKEDDQKFFDVEDIIAKVLKGKGDFIRTY